MDAIGCSVCYKSDSSHTNTTIITTNNTPSNMYDMEIYVFLTDGLWHSTSRYIWNAYYYQLSYNLFSEMCDTRIKLYKNNVTHCKSIPFCRLDAVLRRSLYIRWDDAIFDFACVDVVFTYLNVPFMASGKFNVRDYRMISWTDVKWLRLHPNHNNNRVFAQANPSNDDFVVVGHLCGCGCHVDYPYCIVIKCAMCLYVSMKRPFCKWNWSSVKLFCHIQATVFFSAFLSIPAQKELVVRVIAIVSISRTHNGEKKKRIRNDVIIIIFNSHDSLTPRVIHTHKSWKWFFLSFFLLHFLFFIFLFFRQSRKRWCVHNCQSTFRWSNLMIRPIEKKWCTFSVRKSFNEQIVDRIGRLETSFILLYIVAVVRCVSSLPSCIFTRSFSNGTMCRFSYESDFLTKLIRLNRHINTF